MKISVIICTHNPNPVFLAKVIASLKTQSLEKSQWEFIIIDNKSDKPLIETLDVSWHPSGKIVQENKLGLIHARIKGVEVAVNEIIVSVDDDTPLYPDYLEHVQRIYINHPEMGIIGGKTIPEYEITPPDWIHQFNSLLAIRDLGDEPIIDYPQKDNITKYPACAPLLIAPKKECMVQYVQHYHLNALSMQLGRKGSDLSSGEDNDINMFIYKSGYALGYFPQLKFIHLIPKRRMTVEYLSALNYSSNITWIKVLDKYNLNPWHAINKYTVWLRKSRAWFTYKAWKSPANYVKWKGACGMFKALSQITKSSNVISR